MPKPNKKLNKECKKEVREKDKIGSCGLPFPCSEHPPQKFSWEDDFELEKTNFTKYDKQSGSRFLDEDVLKSFIKKVEAEAYERGLKEEAINCHEHTEQARQEERERVLKLVNGKEKLDHYCKCEDKHFISFVREEYDDLKSKIQEND